MSDTLYYFSGEKETNTLSVLHKQTHRSSFFLPKVKHCFEAKINEGCAALHIGFSPNSSIRSFISLSIYSKSSVFKEYLIDVYDTYESNLPAVSVGETVMFCLDTSNKQFHAVFKGNKYTLQIEKTKITKTWYATVDAVAGCKSNAANVEVNLGKKEFVNTLPDGFLPFIRGYKTNNCFNTQCKTKHSYSHIFFIIFLQSHS